MSEALNRKALYDLVWSKPMVQVAREYGLSDRGLAKLCERNSIPVPPRGYWAKKAAGQKVKKVPLVVLDDQKPETAILLSKAEPVVSVTTSKKEKPALPESIQEAIDREKLPKNRIKVPATMHNPHSIVASWIKTEEQEREIDRRYGRIWHSPITPLDRRKWKLTSCLFKQLETRGFKIAEEGRNHYQKEIWIKYQEDKVSFQINERIRQYRRQLTDEEREKRYSSTQKWTQEREQTGKLEITLGPGESSYSKFKIQEDDAKPFEDMLNEVVIKVIETMWDAKCRRLESEEHERQRRKEEHERYERKKAAEDEQKRKENLEYKAQSWKRAQELREYIEAVQIAKEQGKLQINDAEFGAWKAWAIAHADEIDFITNGNPLINLTADPEYLFNDYNERPAYSSPYSSSGWHLGQKWYQK